jgi:hypothetical protein
VAGQLFGRGFCRAAEGEAETGGNKGIRWAGRREGVCERWDCHYRTDGLARTRTRTRISLEDNRGNNKKQN